MGAASSTHGAGHLGGDAKLSSSSVDGVKLASSKGRLSPAADGRRLAAKEEGRNQPLLPHNYHTIMAEEADDVPNSGLPRTDIYSSGVYLNNNSKKYWVDKKTGCNCFLLYARALSITWSEDPRYWRWGTEKETSDQGNVEVAALQNVCWLEVHGSLSVANLTPGATYEVAFLVRMDDPAYGWQVPVALRLTVDATAGVQQRGERLLDLPRGRWVELLVGSFTAAPGAGGVVQFSMFEYEGGLWKSGLLVKGAVVRPKK